VAFVSITRLRVRSWRFLPAFFVQTIRVARQAKAAAGSLAVSILRDAQNTFWTRTVWESEDAMRSFMLSGVHRSVMPRLLTWCDEASVVHWIQETSELPSWEEAHQRMERDGRRSKVTHPSARHLAYQIPSPTVHSRRELRFK
jgi:hypothetical protein